MFADDTTISAYGQTIDKVHNSLQTTANHAIKWYNHNSMVPNISKTKTMYISATHCYNHITNYTQNNHMYMQGEALTYSSVEKLLGVHVDQQLNWKFHVEQMLKKCNKQLYLLMRIKQYLSVHSRKLFFNAYILPHLDYCSTIWGSCNDEVLNSVVKFQKRAARIILDKDINTPSVELFRELKWMTFPDRTIYKKAIIVYKSLNDTSPAYLNSK